VVFEFKSAIRPEATLHDAYVQLTVRYRRDIPELLKYNALCVVSDGVDTHQTIAVTEQDVKRSFGFAKYLYDSLPNATYVGFAGTPVSCAATRSIS